MDLTCKFCIGRYNKYVMKSILISLLLAFFIGNVYAQEDIIVVLDTNQGLIQIKLMPDIAPRACENFLRLVEQGYYDETTFHRVIKDFMIQGGDPTGTGHGGNSIWGKPFEDEVNLDVPFNRGGLVAMANSGPNTNRSQFFITTVISPWLNMHHTIFGEVISGYDVVQRIESVATDSRDRPLTEQKIIKAYVK